MNSSVLGFNVIKAGEGTESLLCFSGTELHLRQLLQFQVGMLTNNRIPGLAELKVKQRDLRLSLVYPVGGLVSLDRYLSAKHLSLAELGELLERMVQPIAECKNYFLNEECFVIDPHYMFVNPSSLRTFLIYLPVLMPEEVDNGYQALVEIILKTLGVRERGSFDKLEGKTDLEKFLDFARLLGNEGLDTKVSVKSNVVRLNPIIIMEDQ